MSSTEPEIKGGTFSNNNDNKKNYFAEVFLLS